jgi:hypothetical protein
MSAQLKSVPPRRTEARERLAEAIAADAKAISQLSRLKAAFDENSLYGDDGALRAFERAETTLEEAKASESHHLAAVALGEATDDANPVKLAEHALAEAQSRLDGARKTYRALEHQLKAAETELKSADDDVGKAVRGVLLDEGSATIDKMLVEATEMQAELGARRAVLLFLNRICFDGARELSKPINDYLAAPPFPAEWNDKTHQHPALAPWNQTHEALQLDADAPLPN